MSATTQQLANLAKAREAKKLADTQRRVARQHASIAAVSFFREESRLHHVFVQTRNDFGSYSQEAQAANQDWLRHWREMPPSLVREIGATA
jgi:hypothetical protein